MKHLKVECSQQPLDISFHSSHPSLLAAGLVDGTIEMHDFACLEEGADDEEDDTIVSSTCGFSSSGSCRTVQFSSKSSGFLVVGGSNGEITGWDVERLGQFSSSDDDAQALWKIETSGTNKGIQVVHEYKENCWASGNENGCIQLWDVRQSPLKPLSTFSKQHTDYISALHTQEDHTILATSADGCLSIYDIRNSSCCTRVSDPQEDELLSVQVLKSGQKVVCGTATGVLAVFSWGTWGDVSDRFPGHGASIDAMVAVDESTLVLGTGSGQLRVVTVQPDRTVGVLEGADHGGLAIEALEFTGDRRYLGTLTHDVYVRLFDTAVLDDGASSATSTDTEEETKTSGATNEAGKSHREARESDDEWGDMDKEGEDSKSDDGSSDSDDSGDDGGDSRSRKRIKTQAEHFFDDL